MGTGDPGTTDSGTAGPSTTDGGTADPGTTGPNTTGPSTTDGGTADPGPQSTVAGGVTTPGAPDEPERAPLQPLGDTFEVDDAGMVSGGLSGLGWAGFDADLANSLLRNGNTAASVAVMVHGEIVHAAAFGERVPGTGDPAETQDRFRIGSISKVFTAVTLLQLVEDGVIGLDEPVGNRVVDYLGVVDAPASIGAITVRQLLGHTAGFPERDDLMFGGSATDCRDAATQALGRELSSTPGTTQRYSNIGICVASMLIEALTGDTYEGAVYEHLLTPLGLSGLRLAPTFDPGPDEAQHPTNLGRNYMETLGGAGGWVATPSDLVTVLDSLDLSTSGWKPLQQSTLDQMMRPAIGGAGSAPGYGLGLILYGGGRYGHTGTIEGTHAMVVHSADGVTWALTVAGEYPSETSQLASIFAGSLAAAGFVSG